MSTLKLDKPIVVAPPKLGDIVLSEPVQPGETVEKAKKDRETAPSVQYANFPRDIPVELQEKLKKYQQEILDYRSWASLKWWNTVYQSDKIPQDLSKESTTTRLGYVARIADYDMQHTPWLATSSSTYQSKHIATSVKTFHAALVDAILEGFLSLPEAGYYALEKILTGITTAIEAKAEVKDDMSQFLVAERYEYDPMINDIRSFIRTSIFSINYETVEVNTRKRHEKYVDLTIEYHEYEAVFNMKDWEYAAAKIEEWKKKEMDEFVEDDTVDFPF